MFLSVPCLKNQIASSNECTYFEVSSFKVEFSMKVSKALYQLKNHKVRTRIILTF